MEFRDVGVRLISENGRKDNRLIDIIIGDNGCGKTRNLVDKYQKDIKEFPKKIFLSESYPSESKSIVKKIEDLDIFEELGQETLDSKETQEVSKLIGKKISELSFTKFNIKDELANRYDEAEISKILGDVGCFDELYYSDSIYYYINIKLVGGSEYSSIQMGVGERLIITYYLIFNKNYNTSVYMDEPFNYLSVHSTSNLTKLLIYYICKRVENEIFLTTNSLGVVNQLISYEFPIRFHLYNVDTSPVISSDSAAYYRFFEDEFERKGLNVFVEDQLVKEFVLHLAPNANVSELGGFPNLVKLNTALSIPLFSEINTNVMIIPDGDVVGKFTRTTHLLPLPFASIEDEFLNLYVAVKVPKLDEISAGRIMRVIKTEDIHDSYTKLKEIINFSNADCFNFILENSKNKTIAEFKTVLQSR